MVNFLQPDLAQRACKQTLRKKNFPDLAWNFFIDPSAPAWSVDPDQPDLD